MVFRRDITMMIIPPTKAITAPVPYTKRERAHQLGENNLNINRTSDVHNAEDHQNGK